MNILPPSSRLNVVMFHRSCLVAGRKRKTIKVYFCKTVLTQAYNGFIV
jgi:hypothetical protein